MDVKLSFRFNKLTGEVERFEVEQDSSLPYVEHEREHDRLAAELGALLERFGRAGRPTPAVATKGRVIRPKRRGSTRPAARRRSPTSAAGRWSTSPSS